MERALSSCSLIWSEYTEALSSSRNSGSATAGKRTFAFSNDRVMSMFVMFQKTAEKEMTERTLKEGLVKLEGLLTKRWAKMKNEFFVSLIQSWMSLLRTLPVKK